MNNSNIAMADRVMGFQTQPKKDNDLPFILKVLSVLFTLTLVGGLFFTVIAGIINSMLTELQVDYQIFQIMPESLPNLGGFILEIGSKLI